MKRILIANRGEIARRIIRACHAMGIDAVAVFSEPDRNAPFVREADLAVSLGGSTPAESYLRVEAIIDAAKKSGADAVHPGYGFLAENASFAQAVADAGLTLIGPTPESIEAMGSKVEAKRRMEGAGVPLLPSIVVKDQSSAELVKACEQLGYPVLVKASAGGGGRGMRIVPGPDELPRALDAARQEAESAFGDASVFLEPYVEKPRHVEVQIFGDTHGNVVHLFERECSIQRRYQKVIEESPSVALDDELRSAMCEAAVRAGEAIGYVNAGTVEFLLTPKREFYFLEVNTRLQVEHPVTECVTGLDLVRLQILVAQGYSLDDLLGDVSLSGHCIEARLYAEDPRHDFMPVSGRLQRFEFPEIEGLRIDAAVDNDAEISPYYDSMLAKVIAYAPTRAEAAGKLARCLSRARIHGLRTNRELLVRTLGHEEFLSGEIDTHFFERHPPVDLGQPLANEHTEQLHAVAAALAGQAQRIVRRTNLPRIPSGWRNNRSQLQLVKFETEAGELEVGYAWQRGDLLIEINGEPLSSVVVVECTAEDVLLQVDGMQHRMQVQNTGDVYFVDSALGSSELRELPRFPLAEDKLQSGSLVAPLPGVVSEVKIAVGDVVTAGDVLVVIESMKMLHDVTAPLDGRIAEVRVEAASHVDSGGVLVVIDDEESSS